MSKAPKPWIKWHRVRSQRFEALPVATRGLLAELLAHTDNDGWIRLGTDDRSILWRFIGAHPKERRTLAKHLTVLEENGSVDVTEEGWFFPSFDGYQDDGRPPRKKPEPALSVHSACTERALSVHSSEAKSPKSFRGGAGEEEEEEEGELSALPPRLNSYPDRAREPEPRERWIGLDVIEVTGAELRERGKRWQTPGLDSDAARIRPVVEALEGIPPVTALEWCRRWARDPGTTRYSVGSLATYVAALANGESGWGKPRGQSMRRVATAEEHRSGAEHIRALGIEVWEDGE